VGFDLVAHHRDLFAKTQHIRREPGAENVRRRPSFTLSERFGVIEREGKKLYRYRAKNYRIYFAKTDEGVKVHRVLHKNTLRDFLFRSKLPVSEDAQLGETREFWKLIEEGERTPKV